MKVPCKKDSGCPGRQEDKIGRKQKDILISTGRSSRTD